MWSKQAIDFTIHIFSGLDYPNKLLSAQYISTWVAAWYIAQDLTEHLSLPTSFPTFKATPSMLAVDKIIVSQDIINNHLGYKYHNSQTMHLSKYKF